MNCPEALGVLSRILGQVEREPRGLLVFARPADLEHTGRRDGELDARTAPRTGGSRRRTTNTPRCRGPARHRVESLSGDLLKRCGASLTMDLSLLSCQPA